MAQNTPVLINGVNYSWINSVLVIGGIPIEGIKKIMFKRKQVKENTYARGTQPSSRGYGRKEYEASITILFDELNAIIATAPNGDITDIPMFDFTMVLTGNFVGFKKVTVRAAEFLESSFDASEGDTAIWIELPLIIAGLDGV